jgi:hypothetical protein
VVLIAAWSQVAAAGCDPAAVLEGWNEGLPPGAHPNTTTVRAVALYAAACGDAKTASAVVRGALDWRTADRALTTEDPSWPAACPGNPGLPATPSRAEVWAACGPSAHLSAAEWTAAQGAMFLPFLAEHTLSGLPDAKRRVLVRALAGLPEPRVACDLTRLASVEALRALRPEARAQVAAHGYGEACPGTLADPAMALTGAPAMMDLIGSAWIKRDPELWEASCPAWPEDRVETSALRSQTWTSCPLAAAFAGAEEWSAAAGYPVLAIAIYHDLSQRPEVPAAVARATARAVANLPPAP